MLPNRLAGTTMAPQEINWVRYLVLLYLALSIASWHAYRKPRENMTIIQVLVVMWVGLVLTHLINVVAGDEQLAATWSSLVFDAIFATAFVYFYPRRKREV
jgi:cytochrome bd-type quinol oxidase subunit 2